MLDESRPRTQTLCYIDPYHAKNLSIIHSDACCISIQASNIAVAPQRIPSYYCRKSLTAFKSAIHFTVPQEGCQNEYRNLSYCESQPRSAMKVRISYHTSDGIIFSIMNRMLSMEKAMIFILYISAHLNAKMYVLSGLPI